MIKNSSIYCRPKNSLVFQESLFNKAKVAAHCTSSPGQHIRFASEVTEIGLAPPSRLLGPGFLHSTEPFEELACRPALARHGRSVGLSSLPANCAEAGPSRPRPNATTSAWPWGCE